jgi:dTDP-4-dehydrorhamnose 3,5-epimerase
MPFTFHRLEIPEVILVKTRQYRDARGLFMETYKQSEFAANGIPGPFVQSNCSHSSRGVLRGLHYQGHPSAQGKLVAALFGEILDIAVDIRKGSPTYGRWVGQVLSAENGHLLYVPAGFAHGFCVLSDQATVTYLVTQEYDPDRDWGIHWNDPAIGIDWPVDEPIVSEKDTSLPLLAEADNNFVFGR